MPTFPEIIKKIEADGALTMAELMKDKLRVARAEAAPLAPKPHAPAIDLTQAIRVGRALGLRR